MQFRPYLASENEVDQLHQFIKEMASHNSSSIPSYQELEQRIVIAQPETILAVRVKLTYLFKILLNKRDKLHPESLELQANIQLSQAIIGSF
jgi:hypothetical protein